VIDGEMAAIRYENDESVIDDWGAIQSILGSSKPVPLEVRKAATYMVFDLIRLDGKNARPLPFSDRRNLLEGLFDAIDFDLDRVALVEQTEPSAEAHAHYVEVGFEGSIVKRRDSAYSSNARGAGWDKVKPNETLDGVVMGFREGKSSFAGLIGSIEFGQYKDGKLELVGACSGMDYKTREEISANRDAWKNKVIEVCYEKSIGDAPRFPRFKRVRKDKDPQECVSD
jgi:bifunctional non-homologous end joining protein LigD